jgi:thymidylate kinase
MIKLRTSTQMETPMGYVVFEGIDSVGKSTLVNNLKPRYKNATFTSHPGATPLGRILRRLSKYPNDFKSMDS